jgi:ParB family chromosome partitioning protein
MRLPIKTIEPDPNNPRLYFDEDAIQRLATSIQEEGLLEPISVVRIAPERYRIRYGERRYRAHLHLGRETIDAMIWPADISSNTRQTQLVENLQRQDLDPFSETMAICEWIVGELGEDIISTRDGMLTASKSLARIIRKMRNEDAGRGTPVTPNVRRKIEGLFEITGRWQPASFLTARLNILYWPLLLQDACRQGIDPSKINLIRRITVHSINASPEKVEEVQREFIERAKTLSVKQLKREIDDVILSSTPDANNEKVGRTETELIDTAMQHLQLLQNRSLTPDQRFALESAVATLASLAG